jgi:hypothetical protein
VFGSRSYQKVYSPIVFFRARRLPLRPSTVHRDLDAVAEQPTGAALVPGGYAMVSSDPFQAPERQPQARTAPPGAAASAIPRWRADGLATEQASDHARHSDASRRHGRSAELARAEMVGPRGGSLAALGHPSSPACSSAQGLLNGQPRNGQTQELKSGGLPREVSWSNQAIQDLEAYVTVPAVKEYLLLYADKILHDVRPEQRIRCVVLGEAGADGELMWHRGVPHEHEWLSEQADGLEEQADCPELYFLFYRERSPGPAFEVVAVRSVHQLAELWVCRPSGRLPCGLLL